MIDEDYQAWELYPQYRWVFNKLEIALKLGYRAGPACTPLPSTLNHYKVIIRPIYNLYGMGIGAKVCTFIPEIDNDFIIHHGHIPPGYFWCEYFEGTHYSIDYKATNASKDFSVIVLVNSVCTTPGSILVTRMFFLTLSSCLNPSVNAATANFVAQ